VFDESNPYKKKSPSFKIEKGGFDESNPYIEQGG